MGQAPPFASDRYQAANSATDTDSMGFKFLAARAVRVHPRLRYQKPAQLFPVWYAPSAIAQRKCFLALQLV